MVRRGGFARRRSRQGPGATGFSPTSIPWGQREMGGGFARRRSRQGPGATGFSPTPIPRGQRVIDQFVSVPVSPGPLSPMRRVQVPTAFSVVGTE